MICRKSTKSAMLSPLFLRSLYSYLLYCQLLPCCQVCFQSQLSTPVFEHFTTAIGWSITASILHQRRACHRPGWSPQFNAKRPHIKTNTAVQRKTPTAHQRKLTAVQRKDDRTLKQETPQFNARHLPVKHCKQTTFLRLTGARHY